MEKPEKQLKALLHQSGAKLVRHKRHLVYRLADGRAFVQPNTGSDRRGILNALADLRKLLAEKSEQNSIRPTTGIRPTLLEPSLQRMRQENRPPRADAEIVIPPLGPIPAPSKNTKQNNAGFDSLDKMLQSIDQCEAFWDLCPCGRVRVMMKLAAQFANPEIHSIVFFRTTFKNAAELKRRLTVGNEISDMLSFVAYLRATKYASDLPVLPALMFKGVGNEPLLVDCSTAMHVGNNDQILVSPVDFVMPGISVATLTIEDEIEENWHKYIPKLCIFAVAISNTVLKNQSLELHFETCPSWTNPSLTRAALREAFSRASNNEHGRLSKKSADIKPSHQDGIMNQFESGSDLYQELTDIADPFIKLANEMVYKGLESEKAGAGLIYAAASYVAFLTGRKAFNSEIPRKEIAEHFTKEFSLILNHHLADTVYTSEDLPGQTPKEPRRMEAPPGSLQEKMQMVADYTTPAYSSIEITLVAYLRGKGEGDLADALIVPVSSKVFDKNWDLEFAKKLYEHEESGALSDALAVATAWSILQRRFIDNSTEGYLRDPRRDEKTRTMQVQVLRKWGLERWAILLDTDPDKTMRLVEEGTVLLIGKRWIELASLFEQGIAEKR